MTTNINKGKTWPNQIDGLNTSNFYTEELLKKGRWNATGKKKSKLILIIGYF